MGHGVGVGHGVQPGLICEEKGFDVKTVSPASVQASEMMYLLNYFLAGLVTRKRALHVVHSKICKKRRKPILN